MWNICILLEPCGGLVMRGEPTLCDVVFLLYLIVTPIYLYVVDFSLISYERHIGCSIVRPVLSFVLV